MRNIKIRKNGKKVFAAIQIFLLISVSFAFAFITSQNIGIVSGETVAGAGNFLFGKSATQNPAGASSSASLFGKTKTFIPKTGPVTLNGVPYTASEEVQSLVGKQIDKFEVSPDGTSDVIVHGQSAPTHLGVDDTKDFESALRNGPGLGEASSYGGYNGVNVPGLGKVLVDSPVWGHLITGVMWSVAVVGVIQLVGSLAGLDKETTKALSLSAIGGIVGGQLVTGYAQKLNGLVLGKGTAFGTKLTPGQAGFISGVIIAAAIFVLTYKKQKKQLVTFQCLPWQAPTGGSDCEKCNSDSFRPCTEYRCKSLGQACQLLNPGTGNEKCTWVNPQDVKSPVITPWIEALAPIKLNLKYVPDTSIRPPAIGVKVVKDGNGCLPAFTPLQFGITTDKPAQCKIDYNHTLSFDSMKYYFGGSNYFEYNHTQQMALPGPNTGAQGDLPPVIDNNGQFSLYVRCMDANKNYNIDEYAVNFCVDKSPDTTPPVIDGFSIPSSSYVTYNQGTVAIDAYVNEPAECKWSKQDKAYEDMENIMKCSTQSFDINANLEYTCSGNLTGIQNRVDNNFYFRCKDQPGSPENVRNVMVQSKLLDLKGSQPLNIIGAGPNGTISGSTDIIPVNLSVETSNGAQGDGTAICYYSPTGKNDYISMFQTNSYHSSQPLNLPAGNYNYYFRCVDLGGNADQANINFTVFVDKGAPEVSRVYHQDSALKIVVNKNAQCVYSLTACNYNFNEGIKMLYSNPSDQMNLFAEWKPSSIYYIKCQDAYGNQPDPNKCSIVASAVTLQKENQ